MQYKLRYGADKCGRQEFATIFYTTNPEQAPPRVGDWDSLAYKHLVVKDNWGIKFDYNIMANYVGRGLILVGLVGAMSPTHVEKGRVSVTTVHALFWFRWSNVSHPTLSINISSWYYTVDDANSPCFPSAFFDGSIFHWNEYIPKRTPRTWRRGAIRERLCLRRLSTAFISLYVDRIMTGAHRASAYGDTDHQDTV